MPDLAEAAGLWEPCPRCGGSGRMTYNPNLNPNSFEGAASAPCRQCHSDPRGVLNPDAQTAVWAVVDDARQQAGAWFAMGARGHADTAMALVNQWESDLEAAGCPRPEEHHA